MSATDIAVRQFVDGILYGQILDQAFGNFFIDSEEDAKYCTQQLIDMYWGGLQVNEREAAQKYFIHLLSIEKDVNSTKMLFQCLKHLHARNMFSSKELVDALLHSDALNLENELFFNKTFAIIHSVVASIDYKGCRDLLCRIIAKCLQLYDKNDAKKCSMIQPALTLAQLLISRKDCLMPAYFALNEITKVHTRDDQTGEYHATSISSILQIDSFIDDFKKTTRLVTSFFRSHMYPLVGISIATCNSWKISLLKGNLVLDGPLPYPPDMTAIQSNLFKNMLSQVYVREMIANMLGSSKNQKQRSVPLETALVDLIVEVISRTETTSNQAWVDNMWRILCVNVLQLTIAMLIRFPDMALQLCEKLQKENRDTSKSRDHVMWMMINFTGVTVSKNHLSDFTPLLRLYDLFYNTIQKDDSNSSVNDNSITGVSEDVIPPGILLWKQLWRRSEQGPERLPRPLPPDVRLALESMNDLRDRAMSTTNPQHLLSDHAALSRHIQLVNVFSNHEKDIHFLLSQLLDQLSLHGETMLPFDLKCVGSGTPIPSVQLDKLTIQSKIFFLHLLFARMGFSPSSAASISASNQVLPPSPGLVETFCRMLSYPELFDHGPLKLITLISQAVQSAPQQQPHRPYYWGVVADLFAHRLLILPANSRCQLAVTLATAIMNNLDGNHPQLYYSLENALLKQIRCLVSVEMTTQIISMPSVQRLPSIMTDSEEVNKLLIGVMALVIRLQDLDDCPMVYLHAVVQQTASKAPLIFSGHTLDCMPQSLSQELRLIQSQQQQQQQQTQQCVSNNDQQRLVEERTHRSNLVKAERNKWRAAGNENDILSNAESMTPTLFCVVWCYLLEESSAPQLAFRLADRLGPRVLMRHLRVFCDYVVSEVQNAGASTSVPSGIYKLMEKTGDMVFKHRFIPLDRFILCLAMRPYNDKEAHVAFFVICHVLSCKEHLTELHHALKVLESADMSAPIGQDPWLGDNWHQSVYMRLHATYNETLYPAMLTQRFYIANNSSSNTQPAYYGCTPLRLLTVIEVVVQRFIEWAPPAKSIINLLRQCYGIFRYHDRPLTFLYTTLSYYDAKIRKDALAAACNGEDNFRQALVYAVTAHQRRLAPPGWAFTQRFWSGLVEPAWSGSNVQTTRQSDCELPPSNAGPGPVVWEADCSYYQELMDKLVECLSSYGEFGFPTLAWRSTEMANNRSHAVLATVVELLALPGSAEQLAANLIEAVMRRLLALDNHHIEMEAINSQQHRPAAAADYINALAIVLATLPRSFWQVLRDWAVNQLRSLREEVDEAAVQSFFLNQLPAQFTIQQAHITLWHAFHMHANMGQMLSFANFFKSSVRPLIETEAQFLFACHLVGPLMKRMNNDRSKTLIEIVNELYLALERVDRNVIELQHEDSIADFLYHVKYMYVGDGCKQQVERIVAGLRPSLQLRLKFIAPPSRDADSLSTGGGPPSNRSESAN